MNKPLFSIIIPTYNRAHTLPKCLGSIIKQTYGSWEAIVVDNFSSDNTDEVVADFKDERIQLIKNANHGIIANSRNRGIDVVSGDWVCFLDSDDSWMEDKLEQLLPFTGAYDFLYHAFKIDMKRWCPFQKLVIRGLDYSSDIMNQMLINGNIMGTSTVVVKRSVIGKLRFLEDKCYVGVEDFLFWLDIVEHNPSLKMKYLNIPLALYGVGDNFSQSDAQILKERAVLFKYWDKVTKAVKRDCIRWFMYRKAAFFAQKKDLARERKCLLLASSSSSNRLANKARRALLGTYLLQLSKILNLTK